MKFFNSIILILYFDNEMISNIIEDIKRIVWLDNLLMFVLTQFLFNEIRITIYLNSWFIYIREYN